ncbi:hypothetical protein PPN31114_00228 [Pandoraea pneumonica]|uniref:Uncharacterized protein n=1 Tax=Pandoraea pneumonica TaxID=2508299 RepID=A0A5E4RMA1_9BURK|nr:hypothetical protein PPN31114_00228 [Pandoraea pneumonica]
MNNLLQVAEGVWLRMDGVLVVDEDVSPDCFKSASTGAPKTCISCGAQMNQSGTLPCDH